MRMGQKVGGEGSCSVRRSVSAQQAGLDPEDDTERTVSTVTRHGKTPQYWLTLLP
jgi:hypothetical protein